MERSQVFRRRLSLADLIYAASGYREDDQNQLVSQLIIEGEGELPESTLQQAVVNVAIANPAVRSRLRGYWGVKFWSASGPQPRIRTIYQEWDGHFHNGLSFIDKPLDLITGPVAEIIQVVGTKTFLVFRIHHAVTDGVGLMDFARNVFHALNAKEPEKFLSTLTVEKMPPGNLKAMPPKVCDAATPFPLEPANLSTVDRSRVWNRLTIPGSDAKILLKTILAIADLARGESEQSIRIHVPASLRRHAPEEKTSANLVGMVRLDVEKNDDCRSLVRKFNARLEEKQELPIAVNSLTSKLMFWIPLRLLQKLERASVQKLLKQPRFTCSGTASYIGKVDINEFSCVAFSAHSLFGIPVTPLGSPLMAVLISNQNGTEIVLTVNRTLISDDSMKNLSEKFANRVHAYK